MLAKDVVQQLAQELDAAEKARRQMRQFSARYPDMTIDDAYAVQSAWLALKKAAGLTLKGYKVGFTSKAMQTQLGMSEPQYGELLDDMFFEDGAVIPADLFIEPLVEVELAFILGRDLSGPGAAMSDVLACTDYVIPAIEIVDSRIQRIDPETRSVKNAHESIADNAWSAGVVMGGRRIRPGETDLRWVSALLYRNGAMEETGVSAAVLNHPANAVAWLANRLARDGAALRAGQILLGGSFTRATLARVGDTFHVDYGPLGTIACRFV